MSILKVVYMASLFLQISYLLAPKIEIFLKSFLDKNLKKQPLCSVTYGSPKGLLLLLISACFLPHFSFTLNKVQKIAKFLAKP